MRLLVSNDDGVMSKGMQVLVDALKKEHEVYVSAPNTQQSAMSRCMTLFNALTAEPYSIAGSEEVPAYAVTGTPVDCVRLGLGNLFENVPIDMVVSGINHGPNISTDILYSGTVAAAAEAALLGIQAIAVSLDGREPVHFETAARATLWAVRELKEHPLPFGTVFNLNLPDVPYGELKGIRKASYGIREYALKFIEEKTDDGKICYWPPRAITRMDGKEDADFNLLKQGYATVTPIGFDLTEKDSFERMNLNEGAFISWMTC